MWVYAIHPLLHNIRNFVGDGLDCKMDAHKNERHMYREQ